MVQLCLFVGTLTVKLKWSQRGARDTFAAAPMLATAQKKRGIRLRLGGIGKEMA